MFSSYGPLKTALWPTVWCKLTSWEPLVPQILQLFCNFTVQTMWHGFLANIAEFTFLQLKSAVVFKGLYFQYYQSLKQTIAFTCAALRKYVRLWQPQLKQQTSSKKLCLEVPYVNLCKDLNICDICLWWIRILPQNTVLWASLTRNLQILTKMCLSLTEESLFRCSLL